ncbi:MAG: PD-(D/E)XK nuclease family protein [Patescibacteria group bacterium]|nr:PD-(D/E)XK nuclease family protein [Patescibacteria group bacterium]
MSDYYKPHRAFHIYEPAAKEPFKVSRSKIDLFVECPRCFYVDRRLGVGRPPGFPFTLNSAVDTLLKKEFDIHRVAKTAHPLIKKYGIDATPVAHADLEKWRHNFTGIQFLHKPTNLLIFGAIDDLWINSKGEYIVVDYKSTAKDEEITALDKEWQNGYKRQMEVYQWLLRQNGHKVSDTGYFVYCNGKLDRKSFDAKLEFDITLIPHQGDDSWVEKTILLIKKVLDDPRIPKAKPNCDYCAYIEAIGKVTKK